MRYPPDYIKAVHKKGWEVLIPFASWKEWAATNKIDKSVLHSTTYVESFKGYRFTRVYEDTHLQKLNEEANHFYLEIEDIEDLYGYLPEPIEGDLIPTEFFTKFNFGAYDFVYWQDGKYTARVKGKYLGTYETRHLAHRAVEEYLSRK